MNIEDGSISIFSSSSSDGFFLIFQGLKMFETEDYKLPKGHSVKPRK